MLQRQECPVQVEEVVAHVGIYPAGHSRPCTVSDQRAALEERAAVRPEVVVAVVVAEVRPVHRNSTDSNSFDRHRQAENSLKVIPRPEVWESSHRRLASSRHPMNR